MQFTGRITFKSIKETVVSKDGTKTNEKQTVVVEEMESQYPNSIPFEQFGKNSTCFDKFVEGHVVTVSFNVKATEYNGRHFCKISAWKVEPYGTEAITTQPQNQPQQQAPQKTQPTTKPEIKDDLPF